MLNIIFTRLLLDSRVLQGIRSLFQVLFSLGQALSSLRKALFFCKEFGLVLLSLPCSGLSPSLVPISFYQRISYRRVLLLFTLSRCMVYGQALKLFGKVEYLDRIGVVA